MSRFRNQILSLAAVLFIAGVSATVRADTINVVGVNTGQASTATVVCEFNAQTSTLTFTITNTSAITSPGSTSTITGIGFDLPPRGNASASGLNGFSGTQAPSASSTFVFRDTDLGNVPAGFNNVVLDFGFTTGPSGNFNGGSTQFGLTPGESASFTVTVLPNQPNPFAGLTESQICNAIFVRFQDTPGPGSDVGVPSSQVPEPSSVFLLGSALLGLGGYARKRLRMRK